MLTDPLTPAYLIKTDWISAAALFLDKSTKSIPMKLGLYITWPQWDSGRLCHSSFWQRTWYCSGSDSNNWLNAFKKLRTCYFNICSSLSLQTKRGVTAILPACEKERMIFGVKVELFKHQRTRLQTFEAKRVCILATVFLCQRTEPEIKRHTAWVHVSSWGCY